MQKHGLTTFFISLSPLSCFFGNLVEVAIKQLVHVLYALENHTVHHLADGSVVYSSCRTVNVENNIFERNGIEQIIIFVQVNSKLKRSVSSVLNIIQRVGKLLKHFLDGLGIINQLADGGGTASLPAMLDPRLNVFVRVKVAGVLNNAFGKVCGVSIENKIFASRRCLLEFNAGVVQVAKDVPAKALDNVNVLLLNHGLRSSHTDAQNSPSLRHRLNVFMVIRMVPDKPRPQVHSKDCRNSRPAAFFSSSVKSSCQARRRRPVFHVQPYRTMQMRS
nr:MAG TPA: hypothetical protein [Caudoviricetes sp.]